MQALANSISKLYRVVLMPSMPFVIGVILINGGHYLYNILLGRKLSPAIFSEAGLLLTLLLAFAFLSMTFQLVSAKFAVEFEGVKLAQFKRWINRVGMNTGVLLCVLLLIFSEGITAFFQLPDRWVVVLFSFSLPFYFVMSNYRGFYQGTQQTGALMISYHAEMWIRLIITFLALEAIRISPSIIVSSAVTLSIVAGYLVLKPKVHFVGRVPSFEGAREVIQFFILTVGYELTQGLLNYADILLVKHYFDPTVAGHYMSMTLVGRIIYFVIWMLVMILIPRVVELKKQGFPHKQVLMQYFFLITGISVVFISASLFFPKLVISVLFGEAYLPIANLLWMYALAITLFALANLFVYYYLSLNDRRPVYTMISVGIFQGCLFMLFHHSLEQILAIQILGTSVLLAAMLYRFVKFEDKKNSG